MLHKVIEKKIKQDMKEFIEKSKIVREDLKDFANYYESRKKKSDRADS